MAHDLDNVELRVLGSLVEKQLTTPEYYPLTLNALTAACCQKSNREPVMVLTEDDVLRAVEKLRERNLVYLYYGTTNRTVKYKHMLPQVFELEPEEVAVMAVLLLRGPQTAGEIRSRSERMHAFGGIGEVQQTLDTLATRAEPLIARMERVPGQKEARYSHLLGGAPEPVEAGEPSLEFEPSPPLADSPQAELDELRRRIEELEREFEAFRSQF